MTGHYRDLRLKGLIELIRQQRSQQEALRQLGNLFRQPIKGFRQLGREPDVYVAMWFRHVQIVRKSKGQKPRFS